MRKLSSVVQQQEFVENIVSASDLVGEKFTLLRGQLVSTQFGERVMFVVELSDGTEAALFLAPDGYRTEILKALAEEPIGPVTIEQTKSRKGRPYWNIVDAEAVEADETTEDLPF